MQKMLGGAPAGRGVILSMVLAVLVLASIASALTVSQGTPALTSSSSECLLGTYTAGKSVVVSDPITGRKQEVLVSVTLSVTRVKEGEFLVTALTTLTPQGSGKATIMFTPPLTDMVVSTDTGIFRWSQGKYFIQVIISKELPITSKIEMKVKGECVKAVAVEVRPLKTTVVFGTGYPAEAPPQNTQVVSGETTGYVVVVSENGSLKIFRLKKPVEGMMLEGYVTRNVTIPCNIVIGGILINSVTVKVYVPENLSNEQLEKALRPLLAACTGNLSELRGVAVVFSSKGLKEVLRGIYSSVKSPNTTATLTTITTALTVTTVTAATTTPRVPSISTPTYATIPTVPPTTTKPSQASPSEVRAGTSSETLASTTSTSPPPIAFPRALALTLALGLALIAGAVTYLVIRKA